MTRKMLIRWGSLVVLVIILAVVFVELGKWQMRRLDERREQNATVVEHSAQDPQPYEQVMNKPIEEGDQWQPVTITGTYTGETYQVRYRNQDGAGQEVVSVMRAHDGREVLVNRGFLHRVTGQPDAAPPAPPQGEVSITGYVHRNERGNDTAVVPHDFNVRLINSDAIGTSLGRELVNGYVTVTESSPADDERLVPMALPSLDEGPHLSYAWQWYSFTAIVIIGVVVLIRADIRDRRKAKRRQEKRARARAEARAKAEAQQ